MICCDGMNLENVKRCVEVPEKQRPDNQRQFVTRSRICKWKENVEVGRKDKGGQREGPWVVLAKMRQTLAVTILR